MARGKGDEVPIMAEKEIPEILETDIKHGGLLNPRNMHVHFLNLRIGEARAAESLGT